jgi:hypothetical protein
VERTEVNLSEERGHETREHDDNRSPHARTHGFTSQAGALSSIRIDWQTEAAAKLVPWATLMLA